MMQDCSKALSLVGGPEPHDETFFCISNFKQAHDEKSDSQPFPVKQDEEPSVFVCCCPLFDDVWMQKWELECEFIGEVLLEFLIAIKICIMPSFEHPLLWKFVGRPSAVYSLSFILLGGNGGV